MTNKEYAMEMMVRNIEDLKSSNLVTAILNRDDRKFDEGFLDIYEENLEKSGKEFAILDIESCLFRKTDSVVKITVEPTTIQISIVA